MKEKKKKNNNLYNRIIIRGCNSNGSIYGMYKDLS